MGRELLFRQVQGAAPRLGVVPRLCQPWSPPRLTQPWHNLGRGKKRRVARGVRRTGSSSLLAPRHPPGPARRAAYRSKVLPLLLDQRADALGEQGDVERLLERLAVAVLGQALGVGLVLAGQGDDEGRLVLRVAPQVLGDLQGLAAA